MYTITVYKKIPVFLHGGVGVCTLAYHEKYSRAVLKDHGNVESQKTGSLL